MAPFSEHANGSRVRLRPTYSADVWSCDFVQDHTEHDKAFRMLTVIDEFTRECLAIEVKRRLRSDDVLHCLVGLFAERSPLAHIRSENSSRFTAQAVREWLGRIGVKTLFITPVSPWENEYNESFNSNLRHEMLNIEIFTTLKEAQFLIEQWRQHHNPVRSHSSLGYKPPAQESILPPTSVLAYASLQSAQMLVKQRQTISNNWCHYPE